MSNQLAQRGNDELTVKFDVDGYEVKLTPKIVQEYIVGNDAQITMQEFKLFTELCKVRKLNPFLKEAYCIKYGNKPAQIVVGKDAVLKRAIENPNYDGVESGIIVLDSSNGKITERPGCFKMPDEKLVGGWARVYRKNWGHPTYCSVSLDEAAQRKSDGSMNAIWSEKGATMVEKVAKIRALRETFIEQLGGMYEAEEMGVELTASAEAEIVRQDEPTASEDAPSLTMDDL